MDIKLRARLSAYSKIESLNELTTNVPDPDISASGSVLGINSTGNYTLFPSIQREEIDSLFTGVRENETVTKDDIDGLFTDEQPEVVTKSEIDTLFEEQVTTKPVEKEAIDTLFNETKIGTVSYSEIDSLFN